MVLLGPVLSVLSMETVKSDGAIGRFRHFYRNSPKNKTDHINRESQSRYYK